MRRILWFAYALACVSVHACPASAHGDAQWIMDDQATRHCCGPQDCKVLARQEVRRIPGGWFVLATNQTFRDGGPNLYPSVDENVWGCTTVDEAGGLYVRCLFVPTEGV